MNLDSFAGTILQHQQLCGPPVPGTIDWPEAHRSVRQLAALRPDVICAGHGRPMFGEAAALQRLADQFPVPVHGRYIRQPAITDESGIVYLPPAPFDATPKLLAAAAIAGVAFAILRKRENKRDTV
jgi:hypothetical protein